MTRSFRLVRAGPCNAFLNTAVYLRTVPGLVCIATAVVAWRYVPETKGKSLAEIQEQMASTADIDHD